nr:hypothetical protein [Tanacetum cinerariifolium]
METQKSLLKDKDGEEVDQAYRKSTPGGCQFLRCRLISWQCKKQTVFINPQLKLNIAIKELKLEVALKEKNGIQLTVEKLENASKSLNKLIDSQIVDNYKKGLGYNAGLPPYTSLFMPPKPELSYTGLEEFTNEPAVETLNAKTSKEVTKVVKKDNGAPIIKDWKSDDEDESVP